MGVKCRGGCAGFTREERRALDGGLGCLGVVEGWFDVGWTAVCYVFVTLVTAKTLEI
jgi:hypothetical protein